MGELKMTKSYFKNILFTVFMTVICLIVLVIRTFFPDIMLPHISIPMLVLFAVLPQIAVYYLKVRDDGRWYIAAVLGGLTFMVLPLAAGIAGDMHFYTLFIAGTLVYAIVDFIYTSMAKRMRGGAWSVTAPAVNGLILFLASQAFMGLL